MNPVGPVTIDRVAAAVQRAEDVKLSAWLLGSGALVRALEAAGDRGAHVSVQLESQPYDDSKAASRRLRRANADVAAELRAHGVRVRLRALPGVPFHLKAAVVDGTAYLDQRNWRRGDETIVATRRASDVALIREALRGNGGADGSLATRKDQALALELDVIERAPPGVPIRFESESFGSGPIAAALEARARAGGDVRVVVDRREVNEASGGGERDALARLRRAGAQVRIGRGVSKACVAGDAAWTGSANATRGNGESLDWGIRTRARALVDALACDFERCWSRADVIPT